jgi:hypothetical protein
MTWSWCGCELDDVDCCWSTLVEREKEKTDVVRWGGREKTVYHWKQQINSTSHCCFCFLSPNLYLSKCRLVSEALSGVVKTDRSKHRHPMRTRILGVRMRAAVSSSSFPKWAGKASTHMAPWAAFLCLLKAAAISVRTSPATPVMFLPKSLGKRKKIHR